ncbi:DUF4373 domain-containing protein [Paenibacillus alvei]|uniref:DUF4373 domain-containing protein n=1 Tax=Paenibacillus alvei TaxID=44250 RepID=UPI000287D650|nr:DUF4373 domain-containing protein [Paenibacillus alvei]EJW14112.1 putative phage protein [Paenibacillus alvei DSM 29]EJW16422.1 putative phage protein [Paenibacillus alvei DSM 29]MCY9544804.1 DUF4373 domain-containing protein [Paenibacillus alvei]MCY9708579.1 DUF4373 domain-containing protein [Paenibacillus alvei]
MARPRKEGLEYFPLDVDIAGDDKLVVPIAKYGNRGFGLIIRLLMAIYKNGYYYPWTEKEKYSFSMKVNEDINYVQEVVSECINWGFFDRNMSETYQILTSQGIQKRFLMAANRRIGTLIKQEYSLVDDQKVVSATETPVNDDDNTDLCSNMSTESTQSKVKESKKKLNKNKRDKEQKNKYADFVSMTESEYNKLVEKYGEEKAKRMIEILDNYKGSKGKTYKNDYRAILTWVVEKVEEEEAKRNGIRPVGHFGGGQAPNSANNAGHKTARYSQASTLTAKRDDGRDGARVSDNDLFVRR